MSIYIYIACIYLVIPQWGSYNKSFIHSFKNSERLEQLKKKQQYVENVLHEILLTPLMIISTIGFANDKMYKNPETVVAWILVHLFVIDLIDITWTQIVRAKMIYKLLQDVNNILNPDTPATLGSKKHGALLPRIFMCIIGNNVVFVVMMVMLGLQIHSENYETGDYGISYRSGLIITGMLFIPITSLAFFALANSYWVMELLISLSLAVGEKGQVDVGEDAPDTLTDALNYAVANTDATRERLDRLQKVSWLKKLMYNLTVPGMIVLHLIWGGLVFLIMVSFNPFENHWYNACLQLSFLVSVIVANGHQVVILLGSVLLIAFLFIGFLFYPFFVLLCCRKKQAVEDLDDGDESL